MKNYILMLGIAGVALGSYTAYASNSATMNVTATIAHDVSLNVTDDIDFGTITINPAALQEANILTIMYNHNGTIMSKDTGIISATMASPGGFTANIPNPSACSAASDSCGGLDLPNTNSGELKFTGATYSYCQMYIKYTGNANEFKMVPVEFAIVSKDINLNGEYSMEVTISYTPES
ncbi:MAG: hypothetical protein IJ689_07905 [Alphaproteobacteria bacterium]|nr:hypothetical protein [Alphaproteobacteria bacterium]MBR1649499.1 hypothetical protein [Alphaproteobacteria bacterium]